MGKRGGKEKGEGISPYLGPGMNFGPPRARARALRRFWPSGGPRAGERRGRGRGDGVARGPLVSERGGREGTALRLTGGVNRPFLLSPPLAGKWALCDAVTPSHDRAVLPARGPPLGRKRLSARARARGGPKFMPPAQIRGNPFSFFFSTPFSHLISILQYFMHQKLSKEFLKISYNIDVRK